MQYQMYLNAYVCRYVNTSFNMRVWSVHAIILLNSQVYIFSIISISYETMWPDVTATQHKLKHFIVQLMYTNYKILRLLK